MKKTLKIVGVVLLGVLALVLAVVLLHPVWVGPSARGVVNGLLPGLANVKANLDGASVNAYSGGVSIEHLMIGNVAGVKSDISGEERPEAVSLGSLKVDVSPLSLVTSRIHVNKIDIADLHASCFNVNGTNNFLCMVSNIKTKLGIKDKEKEKKEPSDVQVMVDDFTLSGLKVWLGADFTIDSVKSDMKRGVLCVNAVKLANPPGADAENAFSLKALQVELDPATIYTQRIHIRKILIDEPFASYGNVDVKGKSMNNFDYILGHVKPPAQDGEKEEKPAPETAKAPEDASKQVKVIIDEFTVRGLAVKLWAMPTVRVPVDITLHDIGKSSDGKEEGATLEETYQEVEKSVLDAITAAGGNLGELGKAGLNALQDGTKAVLDSKTAQGAQKLITSGTNLVGDAVGDGAKKSLDAVGDGAKKGLNAVGDGLKKINPFGK